MNKLVIPTILVSITLIAGIFAFMPVEKASTVHTTIATNIDDQNRAMTFAVNMTSGDLLVLIPGETDVTFSGSYVLSSLPNDNGNGVLECGLTDGGSGKVSATNSTETAAASAGLSALDSGDGISLQVKVQTGASGVCQVTIVLDSAGG